MQQQYPINKIRHYTFTARVEGQEKIVLDQNSPLNLGVVCGIRTRRNKATRRSLQGAQIVNDANFDAAVLILRYRGSDQVVQVPLEHIEQASLQAPETGFQIHIGNIDWSQCHVEIMPGVALDTNRVFEFTVSYYINAK